MNTGYISSVVTFPLTKGSLEATCNPMCIPVTSQQVTLRNCSKLETIMCSTKYIRNTYDLYLWFSNFVMCNTTVRIWDKSWQNVCV